MTLRAVDLTDLEAVVSPNGNHAQPLATRSSWAPVPLEPVLNGNGDPPPTALARTDGKCLLYRGRVHAIFGEPEACKGWMALRAVTEALYAGVNALYVDFEDGPASIVSRLRALGVEPELILERFIYVRPDEPLTDTSRARLDEAAQGAGLAVLDGITEALTLHGLDLASNTDVAKWLDLLPRPLARQGAAVITIDHVVKDKEARGRYAIGAQHKLAGVDCAYNVSVIEPFGRGRDGRIKVTVTKDRPGHVRGYSDEGRVADIHLTSRPDGSVEINVHPPDEATSVTFRPTTLMERVSVALEDDPGLTARAVREAVRGKAKTIDLALELLVAEGYVTKRRDGQAVMHESERPYRALNDPRVPVSQPCPDRVPDTPGGGVSPCPHPEGGHGNQTHPDHATSHTNRVPDDDQRAQRFLNDHPDLADDDR